MKILKEYLKKLFNIINKDEMKILPGHLSFFLVLSIIPCITLFGIICSLFSVSINDIISLFSNNVPKEAVKLLESFIVTSAKGGYIGLYFVVGFLLASNGAYSVIITSNTLYNIKHASYLEGRIKALFLTIILMFLFLFVLVVLAFGNVILKMVLHLEMFDNISNNIYHLFVYLKWPVAFLVILMLVKLLYTLAPDKKIKSKYVNKGSVFTTIGWLFVTAIYSFYANNIVNYGVFYGSLSSIIILMIWIYIISYIFVVGIAINVNNYNYVEENVNHK